MSKLVIVESPTKVKTIKKYLGTDYDVVATMGHIRDLPESRLSVDIKKKFGKNAILKGMNLLDGATAKERNQQIGGHKA